MGKSEGKNRGQVNWADRPPEGRSVFVPILSPKVCQPVTGIIVGRRMYGVFTHFVDGRTKPCIKGAAQCFGCSQKMKKKWKGYVGVVLPGSGKKAVAEVTAEAARKLPALFHEDGSLRGKILKLTRLGKHPNSTVGAELQVSTAVQFIPPEFDVMAVLYKVWDIDPLFPCGDPGDSRPPDRAEEKGGQG